MKHGRMIKFGSNLLMLYNMGMVVLIVSPIHTFAKKVWVITSYNKTVIDDTKLSSLCFPTFINCSRTKGVFYTTLYAL